MILCVKGHSSERNGCARCTGFGRFIGEIRTNESFRETIFAQHHHFPSVLEDLEYLNMVRDVPLDPMHLLDFGVRRKKWYFFHKVLPYGKKQLI